MSKFKVGDKVRRVSGHNNNGVRRGEVYEVGFVNPSETVLGLKGIPYLWESFNFERVYDLDQEKVQLEKRLAEVKRLIEERDKPKGMVMLKDGIKSETIYFFVCTDPEQRLHDLKQETLLKQK